MLSFLFLFVYVRFVLFMPVKSFLKKNKKVRNFPNDLIYITTYKERPQICYWYLRLFCIYFLRPLFFARALLLHHSLSPNLRCSELSRSNFLSSIKKRINLSSTPTFRGFLARYFLCLPRYITLLISLLGSCCCRNCFGFCW